MITPLQRFLKARSDLLLDEPFFGMLLMHLKPVEDASIPTFRTDGTTIWFNPAYQDRLNPRQLRTILCHEVMQPALLHPYRLGQRDLRLANIAADYVINAFIENYNNTCSKRGECPPFEWPSTDDGTPDVLLDHQYDGMAFEEISNLLAEQKSENGSQKPGPVLE